MERLSDDVMGSFMRLKPLDGPLPHPPSVGLRAEWTGPEGQLHAEHLPVHGPHRHSQFLMGSWRVPLPQGTDGTFETRVEQGFAQSHPAR